MAITFPASPTNGQTFTSGNKTWQWDGTTWLAYGASLSPTVLKVDAANARVGINNQSPAYALDVNGTIEGTQFIQGTDYLSPYQGFRNKIINGGFNIWQRATSFSAPANVAYTADRWASIWGTAQRTYSRVAGFSNFQYALRLARDTGSTNTGNSGLVQAFETADCYQLQGKTVTLSFYARCGSAWTTASSQLSVTAYTGTGTDQSVSTWYTPGWTGAANPLNSTATLTTTAQRFTYTFTVASNATQLIIYLNSAYVGTATANDYFEITGVQLEQGSVATPFEQRPIGTELALCQRYYYAGNPGLNSVGMSMNTNQFGELLTFAYPVTMRATPTITNSFVNVDNAVNSASYATNNYFSIKVYPFNTGFGYGFFTFTFVASAEL